MSFLKSKHSGWTWELKRTPFGGGGGGWNPVSAVTDFISSPIQSIENVVSGAGNAVGSGINAIGDAVAPVLEPVYQPIGSGAEQAGQGVKQAVSGAVNTPAKWDPHITEGTSDWLTENGWMIPLAMMTAGAGAAYEAGGVGVGMVDASGNIVGGGAAGASMGSGATTVGEAAFNSAIANGASQATAQTAADSAYNSYLMSAGQYTAAGGTASNLTPEMIAYANASADPIGSINAIAGLTPEEFTSYTQIIGNSGSASGFTAGQDLAELMQSYPNLNTNQLEDILRINYGTDPMLSADAANLAKSGYDAATIDQVLGYSYSPTELSGTGIESNALSSASSSSLSDTLKNINRARQLSKLLGQSAGQTNYKIPSSQDWLKNSQTVALNQPAQQQFGGLYEMNKNPFTFQNPLANALAGGNKVPAGYDVSGTQGTSLDTNQQNKIFSSLLRS